LHEAVRLQKLVADNLVKNFPMFYTNRNFITAFTKARSIQSIPSVLVKSYLIRSSHTRLSLNTKMLCALLFLSIQATCCARIILSDLIILMRCINHNIHYYAILSSVLFFSFPLDPSTLLRNFPFESSFSVPSVSVRDQVSLSYTTTYKIMMVYISILAFLDNMATQNISKLNCCKHP
jgi:hypothetical protein